MQLYKYRCKAGTYNCTITRWEQLSRQQFCRDRYGATVNHRLNESTILGWCKKDNNHTLVIKWEYYRLERRSNFSNRPCAGKGLAGPSDLDLSTELIQSQPLKKYRGGKNKKHQTYKTQSPNPLDLQNEVEKSLFCLNSKIERRQCFYYVGGVIKR